MARRGEEKEPVGVIIPMICGHCLKPQRGHAFAADRTPLCHPLGVWEYPDKPSPPDCYHLVTVYQHPMPCPKCPGRVGVRTIEQALEG